MRGKLFSLCSIFILRSASYLTLIVSLRAALPISRCPSHFTLCFSFHAPLLISRSPSHFTLRFSFHAPLLVSRPLLISRSASHFMLPFSFHALLLISCPSHDLNTWNGPVTIFECCSVFCSVLQKYLREHFSSVVRVIDISYF